MTLVGTLWGDIRQRQTKVILSVAALNDFELELPGWSLVDRPAEFTTKFPYGKIPGFEGTDGYKLIEGAAIARYVSSIGTKIHLLGSGAQEAGVVDQWVHFAEHEIGTPAHNLTRLAYGLSGPFSREALDKETERLFRSLSYLESHLATHPSGYVALDVLTLADLVVAGVVFHATRVSLGAAERARYPNIFAHYSRVTGDEKIKQYWGASEGFVDVRVTELIAPPQI